MTVNPILAAGHSTPLLQSTVAELVVSLVVGLLIGGALYLILHHSRRYRVGSRVGGFVASDAMAEPKDELTRNARKRRLLESLDRFLTEAVHLGFSEEEVARLVTTRSRQFHWNPAKAGSK